MAVLAGKLEARRAGCAPLAGKSTLNRLEHAPVGADRYRKIAHDPATIERLDCWSTSSSMRIAHRPRGSLSLRQGAAGP
jgi:hypothetical protein